MEMSKVKVMILGVYHFNNNGGHLEKVEIEDVLTEEKQEEINEVIEKLAKFKPTKILVEGRKDRDGEFNVEYSNYCIKKVFEKNKIIEERNEIFQLGFKLAEKLNHHRIYPVDSPISLPAEVVFEYAEKNCNNVQEEFMNRIKRDEQINNEMYKSNTVCEILRNINSPKKVFNEHSDLYLFLNKVGAGDNYCGADMITEWYRRNLRIFANIQDIAQKEDRILVIYGAGHCKILQELVCSFNEMELVDVMNYL